MATVEAAKIYHSGVKCACTEKVKGKRTKRLEHSSTAN